MTNQLRIVLTDGSSFLIEEVDERSITNIVGALNNNDPVISISHTFDNGTRSRTLYTTRHVALVSILSEPEDDTTGPDDLTGGWGVTP